ncbi:MAG: PQQ-binding-like beta-propeller repeat protein, partial [bacterium]
MDWRPANGWLTACAALLLAVSASAATTATWEMSNYQDFMHGRLSGVSLTRDGRLMLAPKVDAVFYSGQPEIWSVAAAADGTLYLGTGHRGRVYRIDPSGHGSVYWTSDQPEVFAVALDSKGNLYAATSPDGKIYRIENGKASEY